MAAASRSRLERLGANVRKAREPDPLDFLRTSVRKAGFNPNQPRDPRSGRWVVRVGGYQRQWARDPFESAAQQVAEAKMRGETRIEAFKLTGQGGEYRILAPEEVRALADRAAEIIGEHQRKT